MTFIDWSDPDEMLGLLVEYVADELADEHARDRAQFLEDLSRDLARLAASEPSAEDIESSLMALVDSQAREFTADPVMEHLEACVDELRRIHGQTRRDVATS
jgi:hypothetical protein